MGSLGRTMGDTGSKESEPQERVKVGYSVAVSNRLFTKDMTGKDLPCLNCRMIEMGEMACYQSVCPDCKRPPPGGRRDKCGDEEEREEAPGRGRRRGKVEKNHK